jgi:hypothetical protein
VFVDRRADDHDEELTLLQILGGAGSGEQLRFRDAGECLRAFFLSKRHDASVDLLDGLSVDIEDVCTVATSAKIRARGRPTCPPPPTMPISILNPLEGVAAKG